MNEHYMKAVDFSVDIHFKLPEYRLRLKYLKQGKMSTLCNELWPFCLSLCPNHQGLCSDGCKDSYSDWKLDLCSFMYAFT